ncbi:MAG: sulfatase-like hydrolase/transferase [Nitrospirae bacterium]|nr:sulfatase-like hydrolase/transferase [Nitrospirota bacterium]
MKKPEKIIFISIDTLRADHLGCYGYKRNTGPFIDRWSRECVVFQQAFSACSYTVPSHASMFTGKYPGKHTFGFANSDKLFYKPDSEIMLQEILASEGYETAAFVSALPLRKEMGFSTGFKFYNDECTTSEINRSEELFRKGEETNQRAFEWLDRNCEKDFFLFMHYFDVHGPYTNPDGFSEIFFEDEYYGEETILEIREGHDPAGGIPDYEILKPERDPDGNLLSYEKDARYYVAEYDGGIRHEDSVIERLIDKLKNLDIYDDSLIILTSDHGEAFGENNVWFFHGLTVTPDQIHVPFLIKPHMGWDIEKKTIETHVSLVDIFPTICSIVDYDCSDFDIDGKSLVKLTEGNIDEELTARRLIAEIEGQIAYIDREKIEIKPKNVIKGETVFFYIERLCKQYMTIHYRNKEPLLAFTGERYVPWADDPEMNYEHLHRYRFVKEFVKGKKVLDLGCGEGYGCLMLSDDADSVTGIDIADEAIRHASIKYRRENLKFIQGSMSDIPIEGQYLFDIIISFEALEHITEQDDLLREVKRLLKKDGMFIVSTPNKYELHAENPNYQNEFHVKELSLDEFNSLLTANFKNISLYGQKVCASSDIFPLYDDAIIFRDYLMEKEGSEFHFLNAAKRKAKLFIAIASDEKIDDNKFAVKSSLLDVSETLLHDLKKAPSNRDAHISSLERENRKLSGIIGKVQGTAPALEKLLKRIYSESPSPEMLIEAGEVCFGFGSYDDAKGFFEKAVLMQPGNADALNNLGVIELYKGNAGNARSYFMKALSVAPDCREARINLESLSESVHSGT